MELSLTGNALNISTFRSGLERALTTVLEKAPVGTETVLRLVRWKCWFQNSDVVVKADRAWLRQRASMDERLLQCTGVADTYLWVPLKTTSGIRVHAKEFINIYYRQRQLDVLPLVLVLMWSNIPVAGRAVIFIDLPAAVCSAPIRAAGGQVVA